MGGRTGEQTTCIKRSICHSSPSSLLILAHSPQDTGLLAVPWLGQAHSCLRAFAYAVPSTWNTSLPDICVTPSLASFKSLFKWPLLNEAFFWNSCLEFYPKSPNRQSLPCFPYWLFHSTDRSWSFHCSALQQNSQRVACSAACTSLLPAVSLSPQFFLLPARISLWPHHATETALVNITDNLHLLKLNGWLSLHLAHPL